MDEASDSGHWLHQYGNREYYAWRTTEEDTAKLKRTTYHRPLGLVESAFDGDGRFSEGRADMNIQLDLECQSTLDDEDFRERILFAWTALRCKHLLIQARAVTRESLVTGERPNAGGKDFHFAVDAPSRVGHAVEDAGEHLVFVSDHFHSVDAKDFWTHTQNTARVINPSCALAKMFVLPPDTLPNGHLSLKLLITCSHQISDGIAMSIWLRSLMQYLNLSLVALRDEIASLLQPEGLRQRLPQAQEALYPPIAGTRARQRWFWLLTRILRHVRQPLPAAFPNPLRRTHPRPAALTPSAVYHPVLDYTAPPNLNTFPCTAKTSHAATKKLHRLCREARTSIGAGCFALAAAIQMEFYQRRYPDVPLDQRQPFITGFPLNPRAFFNHTVDPDSLMLAFSDGILLPFLPSNLPIEGRIKLLARRAHAQLATFQKRAGTTIDTAGFEYISSRGAGRLLPVHYLFSIERWQAKLPPHERRQQDPQGAYPMRPNTTGQTCGVSSVGSKVSVLRRGMYPLIDSPSQPANAAIAYQRSAASPGLTKQGAGGGVFIADFRGSHASVRPRDDEFLVGVGGDDESTIGMNASVDANAIDPELAAAFCRRFESILEADENGSEARL